MRWTDNGPIVITGGTRRVGLACAREFVSMGERVVVTYRQERPEVDDLRELGVHCLQADLGSDEGTRQLIARIKSDVGPIRALIHNASVWPSDNEPDADHSQLLDDVLAVHVRAPYLLNMSLANLLKAGRAGSDSADIIHITDYVVEKGSLNHIAYAASKAALANMTLSFARRYAPDIKVNSIAPSLLMFHESDSREYRERTLRKSVMHLEPGPGVVHDAIAFVLDNPYMTGRDIHLDGGRHIR